MTQLQNRLSYHGNNFQCVKFSDVLHALVMNNPFPECIIERSFIYSKRQQLAFVCPEIEL